MVFHAPVEIVFEVKSKSEYAAQDQNAISEKIYELNTGLTIEEIRALVQFIENIRKEQRHTGTYLRKEETLLARTIEIDPLTDTIYIHLKTHNIQKVGRGAHKKVTHSILYDPTTPKLVASAIVKDTKTTQSEIELLELFKGSECIIEPLYVARHAKKNGIITYEIITPLYNKGSLRSFIKRNPGLIPFDIKVNIAIDILKGSCSLNKRGYVSRDNNRGNFFVHEEKGVYTTCLGDLGGFTEEACIALHRKPFGPSARSGAPDLQRIYCEGNLTEEDIFSNHVYSLGRVFHFLYFEKEVPWIETFSQKYPLLAGLYKDRSNPEIFVQLDEVMSEIAGYTKMRVEELQDKLTKGTNTPEEHFEWIIYTMLSTDSKHRKSNDYWLQYMRATFQNSALTDNSFIDNKFR